MTPAYGPHLAYDGAGRLVFDGCDGSGLAARFGTPLWVISESTIRHNYRLIDRSFRDVYPNTRIVYAMKSNPEPAIIRIVKLEGGLVDAITMGHIRLNLKAGFSPDEMIFNGNNKTLDELRWALHNRIGEINVDSLTEVETIASLQPADGPRVALSLRLAIAADQYRADDPDFAAYWTSSKFGMGEDEALAAARIVRDHPGLIMAGLHNHRGFSAGYASYSAEQDLERHRRGVEQTVEVAIRLRDELGTTVAHLNLGGGFRIGRPEGYGPHRLTEFPTIEQYARAIGGRLRELTWQHNLGEPQLLLEPGGFLVSDAVLLLATVGFTKEARSRQGTVKWLFLDNATAYHFVRRLSSNFYHHVVPVVDRGDERELVSIAGPACSVDAVATGMPLPPLSRGDVVAVLDQGAYCEAISSNFCAIPTPGAVLVCDGRADLVRRRETVDEIVDRYSVPERLNEGGRRDERQ